MNVPQVVHCKAVHSHIRNGFAHLGHLRSSYGKGAGQSWYPTHAMLCQPCAVAEFPFSWADCNRIDEVNRVLDLKTQTFVSCVGEARKYSCPSLEHFCGDSRLQCCVVETRQDLLHCFLDRR